MVVEMQADFSGYATKAGLKCSDGRTIVPDAFKHQDQMTVPLVWQHGHNEPGNVLGHALLENRDITHPEGAGTYTYGFFNDTPSGQSAKTLVQHKDITNLSIYANKLVERAKSVLHGSIKEVSLVLSGANPGALIDNVALAHSDGEIETLEDEAIIYTNLVLEHADSSTATETKTSEDTKTVQDVYDSLNDEQKEVVHFMIGAAIEDSASSGTAQHSDVATENSDDSDDEQSEEDDSDDDSSDNSDDSSDNSDDSDDNQSSDDNSAAHSDDNQSDDTNTEGDLNHQEGTDEMTNVFEQNGAAKQEGPVLTHSQIETIVADAQKNGSFKDSLLAHAAEYGIEDIDILFPDAKSVTSQPDVIGRRQEWVQDVIGGSKHSPFSRIKSTAVDLTADEARAKGYVKGNLKKDEIIKLLKRVTTPTTIYKKQKLDRDDIIDITDLDVVAWLKAEMRVMLDEELARAVLIGDGRETDDEDHIDEDHIRPIAYDADMYAHQLVVASDLSAENTVEAILRARTYYKGTGTPTLYTTDATLTDLILQKDKVGRRLYETEAALAAALRVSKVVTVEVLDDVPDIVAIIVNIADYTIGADRGGNVSMFDDFDIDYNQYKYLIETRCSGALTKPKSAIVVKRTLGTVVSPTSPSYNGTTHTLTVPSIAGVVYSVDGETVTGDVVLDETTDVEARPASGYSFPPNTNRDWTFVYTA